MNKKLALLSFICILSNKMIGQVDSTFDIKSQQGSVNKSKDKTEYIFDLKKSKINTLGIYFSPEFGVSNFNKNTAPLAGGSFMVLFNKKVGVGFSGQITGNPNNNKEIVNLGYGGVKLEYTIKPNSKVHATIPLIIGSGFANNDSVRYRYGSPNRPSNGGNQQDWHNRNEANQYFIVQPGVNIEANLIRFIKIFGGVNYRLATKVNNGRNTNTTDSIKPNQVSGITATIGIKIGLFDYKLHKKDSLAKKLNKERAHNQ
jgi:hypothetical protein